MVIIFQLLSDYRGKDDRTLDGELVLITRSRFSLRQDLNVISFIKPAERDADVD